MCKEEALQECRGEAQDQRTPEKEMHSRLPYEWERVMLNLASQVSGVRGNGQMRAGPAVAQLDCWSRRTPAVMGQSFLCGYSAPFSSSKHCQFTCSEVHLGLDPLSIYSCKCLLNIYCVSVLPAVLVI